MASHRTRPWHLKAATKYVVRLFFRSLADDGSITSVSCFFLPSLRIRVVPGTARLILDVDLERMTTSKKPRRSV